MFDNPAIIVIVLVIVLVGLFLGFITGVVICMPVRKPQVGGPEIIEFVNGEYAIRRDNQRSDRGVEFLDLNSATEGWEHWWSFSDISFSNNCSSPDLLLVRKIFLEKPYLKKALEAELRLQYSKEADLGYVIPDLDVATAEYKLSGQHK